MSKTPKLNREQMFNQDFVRYIKAHKCLYDNYSEEYRQKDVHAKAWADVSSKCGESVLACRKRWRNLKTSTCRYIKQLQTTKMNDSLDHKEYYLYGDMQFVIPYLKTKQIDDDSDDSPLHDTRSSKRTQQSTRVTRKRIKVERPEARRREADPNKEYQEYELVTGDEGNYIIQRPPSSTSDDEGNVTNIIEIERDQDLMEVTETTESAEETSLIVQQNEEKDSTTFTFAEVTPHTQTTTMTDDELFLKSLLPDIATMNKDQKRKFKIRVLTLIDELLS